MQRQLRIRYDQHMDYYDHGNNQDNRLDSLETNSEGHQDVPLKSQREVIVKDVPEHKDSNRTKHVTPKVVTEEEQTVEEIWPNPKLLERIAKNKTIVMISANCGYVHMAQNWIIHMRRLGITNFLVVAQDEYVYHVLHAMVPRNVILLNRGPSSRKFRVHSGAFPFSSQGFYEICRQRPHMISSILSQGYHVVYSDTDLVWKKNALERIEQYKDVDYVGITDVDTLDEESDRNNTCTALVSLKPTQNATNLLNHWTSLMANDKKRRGHDQGHWQQTLRDNEGRYSMQLLSKKEFPPGFTYFTDIKVNHERYTTTTDEEVYTVHANWMKGYATKVQHLKDYGHWLISEGNELTCETQKKRR